MINKTFLENKLNNIAVSETKLEIGTIKTYDFGNIKLNAYLTNDVLNDVTYIVQMVMINSILMFMLRKMQ